MPSIKNSATKAAVFLVLVALLAGCRPAGVRDLLDGQKLLDQGKYGESIEKLRTATSLLGNTNAQSFNYLGVACHHAGQLAEAEKAYRRALALNADLTESHYNLGCLLMSEGRLEPAKAELMAYTLRRSNSIEGWLQLGTVELRLSGNGSAVSRAAEVAAAEKSFEEALRLNPQSAEGLNGLGLARLRRNHAAEAANLFTRALKEQPNYRPALVNLAIVMQQNLNQPQAALRRYREYLDLKPAPPEVDAIILIVKELEQQMAPPHGTATTNRITAQTNTNAPENKLVANESEILAAAPKPLASNSNHPVSTLKVTPNISVPKDIPSTNTPKVASAPELTTFSNVEVVKLSAEPVFKPAQDVVADPPREPVISGESPPVSSALFTGTNSVKPPKRTLLQRLNPLHLFSGDARSPALTPLDAQEGNRTGSIGSTGPDGTTAEKFPRYSYKLPEPPAAGNRMEAERVFGQALRAQENQRLSEAIKEYERAAELDPSFYDVYYNLGLAATQTGDLPGALNAYEIALAIRPESQDARYNFALLLKQANYPIDSVNELEKLLASSPGESRAHLALGNLYAQQFHDIPKARSHYLRLLDSDPHNSQADAIRHWLTLHPR